MEVAMQILVNSSNRIDVTNGLEEHVRANLESELERFSDRLTRVEVHLNDENSIKSGPKDKRCQMEARIKSHDPVSVTHMADSLHLAIDGAASKLSHALEHTLGKLDRA
jgi:ribosomal subunit interface protein